VSARPLTREDRERAFRRATHGFAGSGDRWARHAETGLTDEQLKDVLAFELGIFGGSCGPGHMDVAYQGAGLKIWAAWHSLNTVQEDPIFQGAATIAMARQLYGIGNPNDTQLALL
jgi:hypothetical protein